jgi:hypothetical protein
MNSGYNHQQPPGQDELASMLATTRYQLEEVQPVLERAGRPDVILIEQAEAQLGQIILAMRPLSPYLSEDQLLYSLREARDDLNMALDEYEDGNGEACSQHVKDCQDKVSKILTAWKL